jgi:hypothetical protein
MKKTIPIALVAALVALCAGSGGALSGFSLNSVRGTYATTVHGTVDGTGTLVADGAGNVTGGSETVNDGMTNVCTGTIKGSYTVNPDGTGTLTIHFTTTNTIHGACPSPSNPMINTAAIVVVSERRIDSSGTDPGLLESGSLTRQTRPEREED